MNTVDTTRSQFQILRDNPGVAYLDSAATTQKPDAVVAAMVEQLTSRHANAGRGIYPWANAATQQIEHARVTIKHFLGDHSEDSDVVLTSGTTEALDLIAGQYLVDHLRNGDQIMYPAMDHRANEIPWLNVVKQLESMGVQIDATPLPYTPSGDYDFDEIRRLATDRLRFVAMTHIHHVYGTDMDVVAMRNSIGDSVLLALDCAQSVGHTRVDVVDLDVDFAAFSGHKVFGPTGTGALWVRNSRGGSFRDSRWLGTPNLTGVAGLVAAIDWIESLGTDAIHAHVAEVTTQAVKRLGALPEVQLIGCSQDGQSEVSSRHGIVTFCHNALPAGDIGFVLAAEDIYVRSDSHCQAGASGENSVRASFHVYSSDTEVNRLVEVIASL